MPLRSRFLVTWSGRVLGLTISLIALGIAGVQPALATVSYNLTNLGSLGGNQTIGADIDFNGQVVGFAYTNTDASEHAFLYDQFGTLAAIGELPNGNRSQAYGINGNGQIVGYSSTNGSGGSVRAFIYDTFTSSFTPLGTLGGTYNGGHSTAADISDSGLVVGSSYVSNVTYQEHAFVYDTNAVSPTLVDIGTLAGDIVSSARAVNYYGQVVGVSIATVGNMIQNSFLYDPNAVTVMKDLTPLIDNALGGTSVTNSPNDINDLGQVVGSAFTGASLFDPNGVYHAYIYHPTFNSVSLVNDTIGISTTANGINLNQKVVGASWDGSVNRAYVYDLFTNTMTDLNTQVMLPAGWTLLEGRAINDNDQIVVTATNGSDYRAFLLTPITNSTAPITPDPDTGTATVAVNGGNGNPGGISATFQDANGSFFGDYNLFSASELSTVTGPFNFALPNDPSNTQVWDLVFTGTSNGDATRVTLTYDENALLPGTDESALVIYHYTGGQWQLVDNIAVDIVANTISFDTFNFSPFALALVPEPGAMILIGLPTLSLLSRRQRGCTDQVS